MISENMKIFNAPDAQADNSCNIDLWTQLITPLDKSIS